MKAKINGIDQYFVDSGGSSRVPVVFIHGFPFSHEMWSQQVELLKNDRRTIVYDLRGHGGSGVGDGQYAFEFLVDDLIGLFDHLKVGKAVLCGLSIGGYIALRAAERNPERVLGLILCDTQSAADSNEAKLRRATTIKAVKAKGVDEYAEGLIKALFAPSTLTGKGDVVEKIKGTIKSTSSIGICGTLLALAGRTDTTPFLPGIKIPVSIIVGEQDQITPPRLSEDMQSKIPRSELHVISDAGHLSNLENPDAFNKHLLDFLRANFSED